MISSLCTLKKDSALYGSSAVLTLPVSLVVVWSFGLSYAVAGNSFSGSTADGSNGYMPGLLKPDFRFCGDKACS